MNQEITTVDSLYQYLLNQRKQASKDYILISKRINHIEIRVYMVTVMGEGIVEYFIHPNQGLYTVLIYYPWQKSKDLIERSLLNLEALKLEKLLSLVA